MVLKVLSAPLQASTAHTTRMQFNAKVAAAFSNPNLVTTQEFGNDPQFGYYMIREYVSGRTLAELLREKGVFNQIEFFDIFHQTCKGLAYLHRKGYLHGHVKPNNIIITEDYVVRVVDIGLTRAATAQQPDGTEAVGDSTYMSPEQCMGQAYDQRGDIYALGCVMYQALSQNPPFGTDGRQTAMKHTQEKPTPFLQLIPARKVDPQIETIIFRCMEKKPEGRYQSLDLLQTDMRRIEEGEEIKPLAAPSGGPPAAVLIAVVAAVILLGAGGYAGFIYFSAANNKTGSASSPASTSTQSPDQAQETPEAASKGEEATADEYIKQGKFNEAVEIYNKLEPEMSAKYGIESKEHVKILHKLGKSQLWNTEVAGAKDTYGVLAEILRKNPRLAPKTYKPQYEIFGIAKELYAKDKLKPADDAFTLAYKIDKHYNPQNTPMRYHMLLWEAKLESLNLNFENAEQSFEKAIYAFRSEFDDPDNLSFGLMEYGRMMIDRAGTDAGKGGKDKKFYKKAKNLLKEALQIREMRGSPAEVAETKELLKTAKAKLGQSED